MGAVRATKPQHSASTATPTQHPSTQDPLTQDPTTQDSSTATPTDLFPTHHPKSTDRPYTTLLACNGLFDIPMNTGVKLRRSSSMEVHVGSSTDTDTANEKGAA
ncbi:hypothetical protein OPT61_g10569 [Boeremia exigua]|uniref:Uncharacterized protein n=1 Tax=Boeremia exigua TaxID=749465 RepID=A0ACC2HP33_9PLEO|nr:hypothetical protein OPT61_g10569 [Boeremia exigua]